MRTWTRLLMCLLLFPTFLSGCLVQDDAPDPAPAATASETRAEQTTARTDARHLERNGSCTVETLFTFRQDGTWTDRKTSETFDVPDDARNLTVTFDARMQANVEYRASITDPQGDVWYHAYMAGYEIDDHDVQAWGGYREGHWDDARVKESPAGEHTFSLHHIGPVEDLAYVVTGEVCG